MLSFVLLVRDWDTIDVILTNDKKVLVPQNSNYFLFKKTIYNRFSYYCQISTNQSPETSVRTWREDYDLYLGDNVNCCWSYKHFQTTIIGRRHEILPHYNNLLHIFNLIWFNLLHISTCFLQSKYIHIFAYIWY
jgi:hypothetical protein